MKAEPKNPLKLKVHRTKNDADQPADELVEAIFKVNKADYVPAGVRVRSRINATMFTGELRNAVLDQMEYDTNVVSVSRSKRLRLID